MERIRKGLALASPIPQRIICTSMIVLYIVLLLDCGVQAQILLSADYTDSTNARQEIKYHLNVFNRITPIKGIKVTPTRGTPKVCVVRPLGGTAKNGRADLTKDSYKWDARTRTFYTDFTLLKKQIDTIFRKGLGLHQLVLDNPSWAFQRDHRGKLIGDSLKVSTYGNALPPRSYTAWAVYLKEVMHFLLETYGRDKLAMTQFGIGREIGTPTHWSGTQLQFFEFYKVSVEAIKEVLPNATVGTHFLWGSSNKSWGPDFIKWAKNNHVHYDFIGVSYYPFYNQKGRTDFNEVYAKDFAVIKDIPEWNKNAKLEMHEFALIKTLGKAGNSFESAPRAHQNAFMIGLNKMFLENGMENVFQWGNGDSYKQAGEALFELKNQDYYHSQKSGTQRSRDNYVEAIFSATKNRTGLGITAYNYNANPNFDQGEDIMLQATIDAEPGTSFKYRSALYDKNQDIAIKSQWNETVTTGSKPGESIIKFRTFLPAFSFLRYEIAIAE
ncbi:MAG: glycosyl hydrolase 53 family protein [Leeuwenhoekiella sp.]